MMASKIEPNEVSRRQVERSQAIVSYLTHCLIRRLSGYVAGSIPTRPNLLAASRSAIAFCSSGGMQAEGSAPGLSCFAAGGVRLQIGHILWLAAPFGPTGHLFAGPSDPSVDGVRSAKLARR